MSAPTPSLPWKDRVTRHIGGPETVTAIGKDAGASALFIVGNWLNDHVFPDAPPAMKALINTVCGLPMAIGIPGTEYKGILWPDLKHSWGNAHHKMDVPDFIMAALTTTIAGMGAAKNDRDMMQSAAVLATLFSMAGALEDGIRKSSGEGIKALKDSIPQKVMKRVTDAGGSHSLVEVGIHSIKAGDHFIVEAGKTVPIDGELVHSHLLNGANKTPHPHAQISMPPLIKGESFQAAIEKGGHVPQGAITEGTELLMKASKTAKESTTLHNVNMIERAIKDQKGSTRHSIKGIVDKYVWLMVAAVGSQFAYSYLHDKKKHEKRTHKGHDDTMAADAPDSTAHHTAHDTAAANTPTEPEQEGKGKKKRHKDHDEVHTVSKAVQRTTELAIKMAPCAIMAAMLVMPFLKKRMASEFGVVVREDMALEKASKITHAHFDLNGTLTAGSKYEALHVWDSAKNALVKCEQTVEHELLGKLAQVTESSSHRVSKCVSTAARERSLRAAEVQKPTITTHFGKGLQATLHGGEEVVVGSRKLFEELKMPIPDALKTAAAGVDNAAYFSIKHTDGSHRIGCIDVQEKFREGTVEAIKKLRERGVKVSILTGSDQAKAAKLHKELSDGSHVANNQIELHAELSPDHKIAIIDKTLDAKGATTMMMGDAENDSAVLAHVRQKGGVTIANSETGAGSSLDVASVLMKSAAPLPDFMDISKKVNTALALNVGVAGSWMTFLIWAHFFKPKAIEGTKESAVAHELPTVAFTAASLIQSMRILATTLGKSAAPAR